MYNNNQVRGLCKFIGMLQTPTTLSDYKRNIYELKDIKKQAENWFTIAFLSSCPGADYAVVKLRDERRSRCDFHFAANTTLASLEGFTLTLFLPSLSFSKSDYSVIQLGLTVSGSQLQDTIWEVPEDPLLCGVNSGVSLHILSELPLEGVELHYGRHHAYSDHCGCSFSALFREPFWSLSQ